MSGSWVPAPWNSLANPLNPLTKPPYGIRIRFVFLSSSRGGLPRVWSHVRRPMQQSICTAHPFSTVVILVLPPHQVQIDLSVLVHRDLDEPFLASYRLVYRVRSPTIRFRDRGLIRFALAFSCSSHVLNIEALQTGRNSTFSSWLSFLSLSL